MARHDDIADAWILWALAREDVRALWVEGAVAEETRRPYPVLELHVAADEPSFPGLLASVQAAARDRLGAELVSCVDAVCRARELRFRQADGRTWALFAERTSMLPKRPRAHVAPLLDRTGHLTHVMDFSLRRR